MMLDHKRFKQLKNLKNFFDFTSVLATLMYSIKNQQQKMPFLLVFTLLCQFFSLATLIYSITYKNKTHFCQLLCQVFPLATLVSGIKNPVQYTPFSLLCHFYVKFFYQLRLSLTSFISKMAISRRSKQFKFLYILN